MSSRSADRAEFARLCGLEIQKAAKLSGSKMPDLDFIKVMALDMADCQQLARIPCGRVEELFKHARANYSETPLLKHLVKSANAIKPIGQPAPQDAPRLPPPPPLQNDRARLRKLAAVRTAIAEGGVFADFQHKACNNMGALKAEEWMIPFLASDPGRDETAEMFAACPCGVAWFLENPEWPPRWGYWLTLYGIGRT